MATTIGSKAPRVAFATLGCKLNQYETDALETRFRQKGYRVVPFDEPADVYVINSCTVTNRADRKTRNLLYRAQRLADSQHLGSGGHAGDRAAPLLVLTGCYADNHATDLGNDPRTLVVPNVQKHAVCDLVEARRLGSVLRTGGTVFDFPVPDRGTHTRTIIKIQDGCDNFCTFCIIPFVRGRAVSRPARDVLDAAREAVGCGSRELVLTGVNMSRYRDGGIGFADLIAQVLELEGDFRLRVSSLEPDRLDSDFLDLFRHRRMSPHVHLCLQSASERVLQAMGRQYSYREFCTVLEGFRVRRPDINVTTDVIAGFPGETDREFRETMHAVEDLRFGHVHTFPYSERNGTRAARLPGSIPSRVRFERASAVREAAARTKIRYRRSLIGSTQRLLVEKVQDRPSGAVLTGFGEHYVPIHALVERSGDMNGGRFVGPSEDGAEKAWNNRFVDVIVTDIGDGADPTLLARTLLR